MPGRLRPIGGVVGWNVWIFVAPRCGRPGGGGRHGAALLLMFAAGRP